MGDTGVLATRLKACFTLLLNPYESLLWAVVDLHWWLGESEVRIQGQVPWPSG